MAIVKKETKSKNAKKEVTKSVTKTVTKKKSPKVIEKKAKVDTKLVVETKKENKKVAPKATSKKEINKKTKKSEKIGIFKKVATFFREVKKEMSYVKWPGKKEMFKYSSATVLFILFFAAFFYIIELAFAALRTLV